MAMSLETLRKLVDLDPDDALSRFAIGKKLYETSQNLPEAAEHLRFANGKDPTHLATYLVLARALRALGARSEAAEVLRRGYERASLVTEGMGRDLAPLMKSLLAEVESPDAGTPAAIDVRLARADEVVDLRHRVLRLGMPREAAVFPGDEAAETVHVVARVDGVPRCCATLMPEPVPAEFESLAACSGAVYRLRGMATDEGFRSLRLGHLVLGRLEDEVTSRHGGRAVLLWCNARIGAVRFYQREGWRVLTDSAYDIPTAGLHHTMAKNLLGAEAKGGG